MMFKVLAVKIAANNFHRKAYFDRIQDCVFNQHLLEVLSGPPTIDIEPNNDELQKQSMIVENEKKKNTQSVISNGETPAYTTVEVGDLPVPASLASQTLKRQKTVMERTVPIEQNKLQELTSDVW